MLGGSLWQILTYGLWGSSEVAPPEPPPAIEILERPRGTMSARNVVRRRGGDPILMVRAGAEALRVLRRAGNDLDKNLRS